MNHHLYCPLIHARKADLTHSAQRGRQRPATRNTDRSADRASIVRRRRLIALFTTIAMFVLPIADAFATRNWG